MLQCSSWSLRQRRAACKLRGWVNNVYSDWVSKCLFDLINWMFTVHKTSLIILMRITWIKPESTYYNSASIILTNSFTIGLKIQPSVFRGRNNCIHCSTIWNICITTKICIQPIRLFAIKNIVDIMFALSRTAYKWL